MQTTISPPRVNLRRTSPDRVPVRSRRSLSTACPHCGGGTVLFADHRTCVPELICIDCTGFVPTTEEVPVRHDSDLPPRLQFWRKSYVEVFRVVRDGDGCSPSEIHAELERRSGDFVGYSTVGHALTSLRAAGFVRTVRPGFWVACEDGDGR